MLMLEKITRNQFRSQIEFGGWVCSSSELLVSWSELPTLPPSSDEICLSNSSSLQVAIPKPCALVNFEPAFSSNEYIQRFAYASYNTSADLINS